MDHFGAALTQEQGGFDVLIGEFMAVARQCREEKQSALLEQIQSEAATKDAEAAAKIAFTSCQELKSVAQETEPHRLAKKKA